MPRFTWVSTRASRLIFTYGTITLCGLPFQVYSINQTVSDLPTYGHFGPNRPRYTDGTTRIRFNVPFGLGSFPFARRYSGNHYCFLFLGVLRCFSSPRSPRIPMDSVCDDRVLPCRVASLGNPRLKGCLLLIGAYRSLPRPSSPLGAKASAVCS